MRFAGPRWTPTSGAGREIKSVPVSKIFRSDRRATLGHRPPEIFVQNNQLTNSKFYDILYTERKRGKEHDESNLL